MKIKNVLIIIWCTLSGIFFCSPTQNVGGETTNGNGVVATVTNKKITCYFDEQSNNHPQNSCVRVSIFNADFIPTFSETYQRNASFGDSPATFDSLVGGEYTILIQDTCNSTVAFFDNILLPDSQFSYILKDTLMNGTTINGTVVNSDTNCTNLIYIKGTNICSFSSENGEFTIANAPQGKCTFVAISRKKDIIGSEQKTSDTLTIDVKNGKQNNISLTVH